VLRYFDVESQLATMHDAAGHYPVHAGESFESDCPRNRRIAGAQLEVKVIAGHSVETRWSKTPYSKFPITIWIDDKSTGRTFPNAYIAVTKIRKELEQRTSNPNSQPASIQNQTKESV